MPSSTIATPHSIALRLSDLKTHITICSNVLHYCSDIGFYLHQGNVSHKIVSTLVLCILGKPIRLAGIVPFSASANCSHVSTK